MNSIELSGRIAWVSPHEAIGATRSIPQGMDGSTEKEVAGEVNNFADVDRLITNLIQALMTDPKFIACLSPAERNSWGTGRLKVL